MQRRTYVPSRLPIGRMALTLILGCIIVVTAALLAAAQEPLGVRRNFLGSHNLAGPPSRETQVDWTAEMNGPGFVFEYVTWGWDTWVDYCFQRGLIPCMRLQNGYGGELPNAGYMADIVGIICNYKLSHPQYADRMVYLQLWNEPGDIRDLVPPETFADFMVQAWTLIQQVIANAVAQNSDIAGTIKIMTPGQNGADWWETAFNHNPQAKNCFDVWGTHPYPDSDPPWWNHHDSFCNPDTMKCIDSYVLDLDEIAKSHGGISRRGFPVMITETAYGDHLGISYEGYPKTTRDMSAAYYVDALTERWYKWPEILAVHHFIMANPAWEGFGMVYSGSTSQDLDADGIMEPVTPYPMYTAWKNTRISLESQNLLAPARISAYRGPVGHIQGTVTRAGTGAPVKYATLYTNGYEFGHISLYDGGYRIENVPVGTYTLTCHKKCYADASTQVTVTEGQTATADFSLVYQGKDAVELYFVDSPQGGCDGCNLYSTTFGQTIRTPADVGFIKFASGKPHVGGLNLRFTVIDGDNPNGTVVGTFDSYYLEPAFGGEMIGGEAPGDGVPVQPDHTYYIKVERTDGQGVYMYASSSNPYPNGCAWVGGVQHPTWDLYGCYRGNRVAVVTDVGTIAGNVKNSSGQNLVGATVTTSPGSYTGTTNANGNYTISSVPVGTYSVTASKSGYNPSTQTGKTVNTNQTTTVNFTLTCTAPSITAHPQSQTKTVGESVTFTVTASGTAPLNYQWRKNNSGITGATSSSYTIASVQLTDAGNYDCVVTNSCGSATSNVAVLTVNPSTSIVNENFETMPSWNSSFDAAWGSAATWTVVAGGQSGNFLQVARSTGGSSVKAKVYTVPASTNITISAYMKCPSFGSSYWMEFAYRLGSYTAQDFDQNPGNWTLIKKFSDTGANGNGNTWTQYSATINTGANTQVSIGYKLGSTGAGPTVGWDTFKIDGPSCTAPAITTQPQSQTKCTGQSVTFTVAASGTTPLSYQWKKNGTNISGATSSSYTISSVTTGDAANYTCYVSNACGNVTSNAATLTVNTPPTITTQPQSQTKMVGQSVTFTVAASGTTPLSYQWRKNGSNISGATSTSYSIASVVTGDAGNYDCVVTNSCGSATSSVAVLTVTGGVIASEDFTTMPSWSSTYNASWGSAATWTIVAGGQSGNFLQCARSSEGSSARVKVYTVPTNTNIAISVYMKCPNYTTKPYWMESAFRLGNYTAQDFDQNGGAWILIQKFSNSGYPNGNGNTWTNYTYNVNTGSNTQISIGYKLGSSGGAGPTVGWDTFSIQ